MSDLYLWYRYFQLEEDARIEKERRRQAQMMQSIIRAIVLIVLFMVAATIFYKVI